MKIAAINGSSKAEGISTLLIRQMEKHLGEEIEIYHAMQLVSTETSIEPIARMLDADVLLIVSPLYVDSLPYPLIELLTRLENAVHHSAAASQIFTIVNGALDASQTDLAIEMIEHFAHHSGLHWGYGVGIGAGSMLYNAGDDWEKGLSCNINDALFNMAAAIKNRSSGQNSYVSPKFPRFLYKTIANIGFFLEAKRNRAGNLRARPYSK